MVDPKNDWLWTILCLNSRYSIHGVNLNPET